MSGSAPGARALTAPAPDNPPHLITDKEAVALTACQQAEVRLFVSGAGSPTSERRPLDVILVLDRSGSMDDAGGSPLQPISDAKSAAKLLVDQLNSTLDRVGLVSYSDSARLDAGLTSNFAAVKTAIDGMTPNGYTNIGDGVYTGQSELAANGRTSAVQVLVVLSDGVANRSHAGTSCTAWPASATPCTNDAITQAAAAKTAGTVLYTIGLNFDGVEADHPGSGDLARQVLQTMASSPLNYYESPLSSDLSGIFSAIADVLNNVAGSQVVITDILPPGVHYVPGSAVPEPFSSAGQTLTWNLGIVGINQTHVITFQVSLDSAAPNQLVDVYPDSRVDYLTYQGQPASVPFPETRVTTSPCLQGAYQLSKTLLSANPAIVGAEIVFGIRITNTGNTTLTTLPLQDLYDTTRLQFLGTTPETDDALDDGVLNWRDLTAAAPGGFDADLAPGGSFTVLARFQAKATTGTSTMALVAGAPAGALACTASAQPNAPACAIDVQPSATCDGWQIIFAGTSSTAMSWRARVDGVTIAQGTTKGNETETGAWPAALDLTAAHTFRAEIYDGSWIGESVAFGNCPAPAIAAIGDRVFEDSDGSGLPDDGSEPGINGVTVNLYGGSCSAATTVTLDAVSTGTAASVTSATVAHTTGAGANRLMLVGVSINRETSSTYDRVTDITYAGQALTRVGAETSDGTTEARVELWALVNPPAGKADVVVAFNRANADGAVVGVTTFTGVDQTTPYGAFTSNQGNGTALSVVVPSAVGELVLDTATHRSQALSSVGADQTERWRTFLNSRVGAGGSTEAGAASVTMSWTGAAAADWAIGAVSIKPANGLGGTPISTAVTAGNGDYAFTGLAAGEYCVDVDASTVPAAYELTTANDPLTVSLSQGQAYTAADFGYQSPNTASIGDRVFYDLDGSGLPDAGAEPGLAGVTVNLFGGACDTAGAPLLASQPTGVNGAYLFSGLAAGAYCVDVDETTLPADHGLTTANEPLTVNLSKDQAFLAADFGYRAACPSGTPNLAVTRGVEDDTGAPLPGRQSLACVDIQARPGAIGDFVWYDADGDGVEDIGELGIANVTAALYRDTGNGTLELLADTLLATTTTDADGGYLFGQLTAGTYFVQVTDANGVLTGLKHVEAQQSLANPTPAIALAVGEVFKDADFGYYKAPDAGNVIIGDTVWYDASADGFQQPNEPGIPGVTVVVTDSMGTRLGSAVTNSNGRYLVEVPAGVGYVAGPDWRELATAAVLTGLTATTTSPKPLPLLVAGQQYLDADFGYDSDALLGNIGNLVFYEGAAPDGLYDAGAGDGPLASISVDLIRDVDGNGVWDAGEPIITTLTSSNLLDAQTGNYRFQGVPAGDYLVHVSDTNGVLADYRKSPLGAPDTDNQNQVDPYPITLPAGDDALTADFGYYKVRRTDVGVIGDQVWVETDADGMFDPANGDVGQAGVTLALLQNGIETQSTTAGSSGRYSFVGLLPGTYVVQITDRFSVLAQGIPLIGPNLGQDNNSQPQPYTITLTFGGNTALLASASQHGPLQSDSTNLTADFGYLLPNSSIGDTVFYDDDRDGLQGALEVGVPDTVVKLYTDGTAACDTLVNSQTTDGDGKYLFANLPPARYCVAVPAADNPSLSRFNLTAGTNPHAVTLAARQDYRDADFGFAGRGPIVGIVFYDWNQDGDQQIGEDTIPNVQVCLYEDLNNDGVKDSSTPLGCATTGPGGDFSFDNNLPGAYLVEQTQPGGLSSTTPNTIVAVLQLTQGVGFSDGNDFGELLRVRLGDFVYLDLNKNEQPDAGEPGLHGVPIRITGVNLLGEAVDVTVPTVEGLYYGADLLPGNYTATAPTAASGYVLNTAPALTTTLAVNFTEDLTLDFGYLTPTGASVQSFTAATAGGKVTLTWSIVGAAPDGFRVLRADNEKGIGMASLSDAPVLGDAEGVFQYTDETATVGLTYWYWLENVADSLRTGPTSVTVRAGGPPIRVFLPLIQH